MSRKSMPPKAKPASARPKKNRVVARKRGVTRSCRSPSRCQTLARSGLACDRLDVWFEKSIAMGSRRSLASYYITSLEAKVGVFSESVRSHWGIENSLHWVMDVVFGEDRSRIRQGHAAENMSFLRRFVTTLLKQDTSKSSLKQKRKEAAWDTDFLETLLFQ